MTAADLARYISNAKRSGEGWTGRCPNHEDKISSFSWWDGEKTVLFKCHAGCDKSAILDHLKLTFRDLTLHSSFEPHGGQSAPQTRYALRDHGGELVAVHVREDRPDGKRLWWEQPDGRRTLNGRRVDALPLYGVEALNGAGLVVVTEGEKARDALMKHGITAVASVTGAAATPGADSLRVLLGRRVVLWPDHDEPGRQHMRRISEALRRLGHHDVREVAWPGAYDKGDDAADFFDRGGTAEECRVLVDGASPVAAAPPAPGYQAMAFTSLGDLLDEPEETADWLVEDRLPAGGLSVAVGKPKAGKSTIVRCLGFSVARGEPWLGFTTQQGTVFYLALEEKRSELRRHFRAMGGRADDPIHIFCATAPLDGLEQLRVAAERQKPALIIVDPLFRFTRVTDANDYAIVTAALEPLMALARETGAHVLVVHHAGKGERTGGDSILGSTAIFGAVDSALILKRTDRYRTLGTIQRYGPDLEELTINLDPETRLVTAGLPREAADEAEVADAILSHLATVTDPLDERAILDAVEGRTKVKVKALRQLVADDRLQREGSGKRGDPYRYSVSRSLVPYTCREVENEKRISELTPQQDKTKGRSDVVITNPPRDFPERETATPDPLLVPVLEDVPL